MNLFSGEEHQERDEEIIARDKAREMFENTIDRKILESIVRIVKGIDSDNSSIHHRRIDFFIDELEKLLQEESGSE